MAGHPDAIRAQATLVRSRTAASSSAKTSALARPASNALPPANPRDLPRSKRLRGLRGAAAFVLVAVNVGDVAGVLPHLVALPLSLPLGLAIIWAPEPPAPASATGGATPR